VKEKMNRKEREGNATAAPLALGVQKAAPKVNSRTMSNGSAKIVTEREQKKKKKNILERRRVGWNFYDINLDARTDGWVGATT